MIIELNVPVDIVTRYSSNSCKLPQSIAAGRLCGKSSQAEGQSEQMLASMKVFSNKYI